MFMKKLSGFLPLSFIRIEKKRNEKQQQIAPTVKEAQTEIQQTESRKRKIFQKIRLCQQQNE